MKGEQKRRVVCRWSQCNSVPDAAKSERRTVDPEGTLAGSAMASMWSSPAGVGCTRHVMNVCVCVCVCVFVCAYVRVRNLV